mmetsp:Transcript_28359/g.47939  ORF Transcript_28359/g.47939 Transcript_28359/m.47939 type:complete len:358 (+) Transcript_28359:139-1212(+)|eukprot:CAMPEP_0114432928 /NCGR_PEP_ID=MMETSP0103-20121206/11419_1 /TAXON_ID=37642 ORGANISM="Paraphysomonas imperforata, Strain PA2" /NCGR_SAMPLE_ID=MMETSP0103 /ASSEMBLY_ACC=CAM_ASM_000201 /LENGTH=357 /DNA_ID=CAMNT_0001602641 /DNA_START=87 /DNA_END=1160 /DNA_ORIENTATION=+
MIEAKEIAEISYQLIRQLSDRIHMAWEDDRAHLLQEITKLQVSSRREKVAQKHLKRQISTLAAKMEEHFPSQVQRNDEGASARSIEFSTCMFDSETQQHPPSLMDSGSSEEKNCNESKPKKRKPYDSPSPNMSTGRKPSSSSSSGSIMSSPNESHASPDGVNVSRHGGATDATCPRVPTRHSTVLGIAPPPVGYTCGHSSTAQVGGVFKYSETARGKVAREGLKGYACPECEGYYRALEQQGVHVSREAPAPPTPKRGRKARSNRVGSTDSNSTSNTEARNGRGIKRSLTEGTVTSHVRGGLSSVYGQSNVADESRDMVQLHSRHRNKSTPPSTPEGFWDLTILTPDEWKQNENKKN